VTFSFLKTLAEALQPPSELELVRAFFRRNRSYQHEAPSADAPRRELDNKSVRNGVDGGTRVAFSILIG
jgi:hypothetical protein